MAAVTGGGVLVAGALVAALTPADAGSGATAATARSASAGARVTATATPTATPSAAPTPTGAPTRTAGAAAERLQPGEEPPQFIVTSFDGGGDLTAWRSWRDIARRAEADLTFFLSGPYLVPEGKRTLYKPPRHAAGDAEINFSTPADVRARVEEVRKAYLAGHEIGTHYNGHFCGAQGVQRWSAADWASELRQFDSFLTDWRTNADAPDAEPLPFGPEAIVGGRTPCLEGNRAALLPALADHGFRYDTSGDGELRWPTKDKYGLWDIPMQELRMAGSGRRVLSMDYNFYEAQSGATRAPEARHPAMRQQVLATYQNAYRAVDKGNRAPLIIGNHFSRWNNGIYADALASFLLETCDRPGTRCVSFTELIDWLEAQTPETRAELRSRPVATMSY